jgi:hypothetical protein
MDTASIISIIVAVIIIYLFTRFVLSPLIRFLFGVLVILILVYLLQRFGFNFNKILTPFGISLDVGWILNPLKVWGDQIVNFLISLIKLK